MFASFNTLKKIGLPNRDFYLYADDHEFSLRFKNYHIEQYIVYHSKIKDIDNSFPDNELFLGDESSNFKLFYTIRNHVYISQKFIKNNYIYKLNKISLLLLIFLKFIPLGFKKPNFVYGKYKIITKAISDGEKSKLGKICAE